MCIRDSYWRVDGQMGIGPAKARLADWTIKKRLSETIKYQLYVYTGELNDLELNKAFGEYSGSKSDYSPSDLWEVARKEGRDAKFLTAEQAVAAMTIKDGYQAVSYTHLDVYKRQTSTGVSAAMCSRGSRTMSTTSSRRCSRPSHSWCSRR